jgi:hypothetical protein
MAEVALNPFQRWIAEAVREAGAQVPAEIDPLGLSFEAEGRVARILPHADEALAVIEVVAISLGDVAESEVERLAVQLLRLNHEARFEHGWSVVIDEGNRLNVTTTLSVADTRGSMLTEILYDGIDRAASLSTIVSGLMSAAGSELETEIGAVPGAGVIRG